MFYVIIRASESAIGIGPRTRANGDLFFSGDRLIRCAFASRTWRRIPKRYATREDLSRDAAPHGNTNRSANAARYHFRKR